MEGLRRYGFNADAQRVAEKFLTVSNQLFAKSGQLWEKTNVLTGDVAESEYKAPPMMGWSAGTYVALAS